MRLNHRLGAAILAAAMATMVACSSVDAPMEPTSSTPAPAPNFARTHADSDAGAARRARHEQLERELEARMAWIKAERERRKADFEAQRKAWEQFKEQWKLARKRGARDLGLLHCEPKPYDADAKIIGPEGGSVQAGPHKLEIPKGALAEEQVIVAEAPTGSLVEVELGPEGLHFARAAKLMLSYKGCSLPVGANLGVVYLGQGNRILELRPSKNDWTTTSVVGDIEHFSRYAVHY